jgi:hypothetical protein
VILRTRYRFDSAQATPASSYRLQSFILTARCLLQQHHHLASRKRDAGDLENRLSSFNSTRPSIYHNAISTMASPKFNSKSPTIKRIRKLSSQPCLSFGCPQLTLFPTHSKRSLRASHLPIPRLPRQSRLRLRPLRLALHLARTSRNSLHFRHLPRPHRSPSHIPPPPSIFPLLDTKWQI